MCNCPYHYDRSRTCNCFCDHTTTYEVQYGRDQERGWWWALTTGVAFDSSFQTWTSPRSFPDGVTTEQQIRNHAREQVAKLRKALAREYPPRNPTQESKMTVGPRNDAASELEGWWREKAMDEIMRTVPKAIEYGAGDLEEIGRQLVAAGVVQVRGGDDFFDDTLKRWHEELGVYFYMTGKMARWRSAIERGEFVSDDTLFDIGVYVRMVQRIRDAGGWPGVEVSEQKHENVDDERPVFD